MRIQLSDHFTYKRLLLFTLPTIMMMVFSSLYGIVDGFFVSNYVGKTPFSAVNLIMPVYMACAAVGFMLGTGGCAVVSKALGEGKPKAANQMFSFITCTGVVAGLVISAAAIILMPQIAGWLGAAGELKTNCIIYGRLAFAGFTAFLLQNLFQSFMVAAEQPGLSLKITVAAGVTNMVLDWLFIGVMGWGIAGAAIATVAGQLVGGLAPLVYFLLPNDALLHLTPVSRFDGPLLLQTCTNGMSEMVSNLSGSLVSVLYNFQLMRLAGEDGIAAYGIMMYVNFIFMAIFFGYAIGSSPVISYHYGAENYAELKNLFGKSLKLLAATGVVLTAVSLIFAVPLGRIFASYDQELLELTVRGLRLSALSFLVVGINVFGSSFFTALNNGFISAVISLLQTIVFQLAALIFLPMVLDIDGVWLSGVVARVLALVVTAAFFIAKRHQYKYA